MLQWFRNLFAVSNSLLVSTSFKFNHCSTVCPYHNGVLLAWYSGTGECCDDQSVYIIFIDGLQQSEPLRIGDCTGNPVLIPAKDGGAIILWSKFEDKSYAPMGKILRLADRWKYCSLWVQRVAVENGKVHLQEKPKRIAGPEQHLLGRCNPLIHNGSVLLPLYDEVERSCVIFEGKLDNILDYVEIGRYGTDVIQPTLWCKGDKIGSLARNFSTHDDNPILSKFCESASGRNWSQPTLSNIWNLNNSLHVVKWYDDIIILWNDTNGRFRKNLTLGVLKCETDDLGFLVYAEPVEVVGAKYGAYPSMCIGNNGDLNFSFTNISKQIEYHVWNHKFFRERRNNRNSLT